MPNLKDIRTRIGSTKNTQQITRAMKMVSAAKLRRAQNNITAMRPYGKELRNMITAIAKSQRITHPLLSFKQTPQKIMLVVLTSDRGLCGGFNNSVNKRAYSWYQANKSKYAQIDFLFIGKKAFEYFKARNVSGKDMITNLTKDVSYDMASRIAARLMQNFLQGEYDEVHLVYNEFKSAILQEVVVERMLPVSLPSDVSEGKEISADMIYEPAPEEIIDQLLDKHFSVQMYRCMSESVAAEHAARMVAMENATKNAGEVIKSLTLTYNKMRQASITKELIEITSGADALNG